LNLLFLLRKIKKSHENLQCKKGQKRSINQSTMVTQGRGKVFDTDYRLNQMQKHEHAHTRTHTHTNKQTKINRQTARHLDRKTDIQMNRQTDIQTDRQRDR
jgi:hypothetical protein